MEIKICKESTTGVCVFSADFKLPRLLICENILNNFLWNSVPKKLDCYGLSLYWAYIRVQSSTARLQYVKIDEDWMLVRCRSQFTNVVICEIWIVV